MAHLEGDGAHQRIEPVLRVYVPGRQRLQPGLAEPDEVRDARRPLRREILPQGGGRRHHRHGDHRRQRQLPHGKDHEELA